MKRVEESPGRCNSKCTRVYNDMCGRLDSKEGEKDLYRFTRQRDRDGNDRQQVRVI